MQTLLLLAGRSLRFWPLREKMLVELVGKALLEWQIQRLKLGGCDHITLVVGPHNRAVIAESFPTYDIIEQEDIELGTLGALLSSLPHCGNDPVMVVCGNDIVDDAAYHAVRAAAMLSGVSGALLAQRRSTYFPGGYITVNDERAVSIVEKPGPGKEPSDLVNIEVHAHKDASLLLATLKSIHEKRDDGYERALQLLFPDHPYRVVPYEGPWQAIKYPWHLLQLLPVLLNTIHEPSIHPSVSIHPSAVIDGPVILSEGVKVMPHATIRGPCFVGPHSTIANNSLVRASSIGSHCVIGFGTEVKASILADHVWTHSTYIGDSVIARNVSFGAGCVTGNLRLDEEPIASRVHGEFVDSQLQKLGTIIGENTRIGIHVGINPGAKIGGGSFIAGGTFVTDDIPDASFALMKDGILSVCPNRSSAPDPDHRALFRKGSGV